MTLTLKLDNNFSVILVSYYVLIIFRPEQEKNEFYDELRGFIFSIQHNDNLVIMKDFNPRVSAGHQIWSSALRSHGVGRMNTNGLHLLSICK